MNKYFNILFLNIFVVFGCASKEPTENKVDMEKKAEKYFSKFKYEYKVRAKKDVNEISSIYISKDEMPLNDFEDVEILLKKDGWKFIKNYNGFITYCYNEYNMLVFLHPIPGKIHIDEYGSALRISNYNNWIIYYNYSNSGIRDCGG